MSLGRKTTGSKTVIDGKAERLAVRAAARAARAERKAAAKAQRKATPKAERRAARKAARAALPKPSAKSRLGTFFISLGGLLVLGAVALTGYNLWEDYSAGGSARTVLAEVNAAIRAASAADISPQLPGVEAPKRTGEMPTIEVDGQYYIGTLTVPIMGIELPVLEGLDEARLRIAPCRYRGSAYDDDMILAAHNYTSHFGTFWRLQPGDEVYFTDVEGNVYRYAVARLETLAGTAVAEMESGEWDLTLFTCTYDAVSRVTVRCERLPDA